MFTKEQNFSAIPKEYGIFEVYIIGDSIDDYELKKVPVIGVCNVHDDQSAYPETIAFVTVDVDGLDILRIHPSNFVGYEFAGLNYDFKKEIEDYFNKIKK